MIPQAPNAYLKNQVLAASPEQLRLMLFDGALRRCRAGLAGLEEKNYDTSYTNISKAQKIVLELSNSLKPDIMPEVCEKLAAIYTYIYRLLMDASTKRDTDVLSEAIQLLTYERETWVLLMEKNASNAA